MIRLLIPKKDHDCILCHRTIKKGELCYKEKLYFSDEDDFIVAVYYQHTKCHYKQISRKERPCPHPEKMIETVWTYIPGECVKEPDHQECRSCGARV